MDHSVFLTILILTIVIFGIFLMVFKNRDKRFFKSILLAVFTAPVIYFLIVFVMILNTTREKSRDFDSAVWRSNTKTEEGTDNYQMIDDLIDRELLVDKDSSEVKDKLGNPELKDKKRNIWQYYTGTSSGFGFTDHQLIVKFAGNKVILLEHIRQQD